MVSSAWSSPRSRSVHSPPLILMPSEMEVAANLCWFMEMVAACLFVCKGFGLILDVVTDLCLLMVTTCVLFSIDVGGGDESMFVDGRLIFVC